MKPYVGNVGIAVKCRSKQMSECIINIYKIITVYYWTQLQMGQFDLSHAYLTI